MAAKGLFLGATGSNAGKTTAALGLIACLRSRGFAVQAAKAGPDFLDAAWLARATDRPCANVDMFMGPEGGWRRAWNCFGGGSDFALLEGAMGLYDGDAGCSTCGAMLAQALDMPVLLILNVQGMGQSAAAAAQGFFQYQPAGFSGSLRFCGLVCSHAAGERHWRILARALEPVCESAGVPLLGYLPSKGAPQLESRHLGLKQACECALDMAAAGRWFSAHVDVDALLQRCSFPGFGHAERNFPEPDITVAMARDAAFAFCYADLPLMLGAFGAKTVYFSPLNDATLPPCDAIYIPGGYPELYGEKLAANKGMKSALQDAALAGKPIYGECGGYMYLMEAVVNGEGVRWPMTGLLPGEARVGKKLAALGYRAAHMPEGAIYGHEFHYAKGPDIARPLWQWTDAEMRPAGGITVKNGTVIGSWVHLYPQGSHVFWRQWLNLARNGARQRNR